MLPMLRRHRALPSSALSNPCVTYRDQLRQHHDISHSPTGGATSDVPPSATITTSIPTSSDVNSIPTCRHCDRTLTSHIGLVGRLRVHSTETGELVPGAPTYTRHIDSTDRMAREHSATA
nr:unnamed protein product [Spirometra erinaceieuropaei]